MQDPKNLLFRYRVYYSKDGAARFIGHLDLQSLLSKALKRAGLPVAYSQGFNPHQLLSIAMPLSLGMAGYNEIFEVYLTKQIDTNSLTQNLYKQMPSGIEILKSEEVSPSGKSAAGLLFGAIYHIKFPSQIDYAPLDEIDGIFDGVKIDTDSIKVTLAAGSKKNLKPQKFAENLVQHLGLKIDLSMIKYERMGLLL